MSNVSIDSAIKTTFLIGLDIARFIPSKISTKINITEYNILFYSKKLKENLIKYTNSFYLTKDDRIIFVITKFRDGLDLY